MRKMTIGLILAVLATTVMARAGTLVSCDFVSTAQGPRYVGTYCLDFECKYTVRYVFTSYCPYMKP